MRNALILLCLAGLAGCNHARRRAPEAAIPWAKADWEVLGKTRHEECGTYLFAIDWRRLFSNQKVTVPGILPWQVYNREESRALYYALEKMPEATHLLAHRSRTTATGMVIGTLPLFGERCVAVEARGVRIGERPVAHVISAPQVSPEGEPLDDVEPAAPVVPPVPMR